jgi:CHAT domain-containing protein
MSHWAVNSEATVDLITKAFYELAGNAKMGRGEALRHAGPHQQGQCTPC